ncbi:MAG: hypothetical protein DMF91_17145 [Acidobacteria bacterium]|nr:MAG: hypothetical protein DMF91_17145 [Acidobacteriota bacterium]
MSGSHQPARVIVQAQQEMADLVCQHASERAAQQLVAQRLRPLQSWEVHERRRGDETNDLVVEHGNQRFGSAVIRETNRGERRRQRRGVSGAVRDDDGDARWFDVGRACRIAVELDRHSVLCPNRRQLLDRDAHHAGGRRGMSLRGFLESEHQPHPRRRRLQSNRTGNGESSQRQQHVCDRRQPVCDG